MEKIYCCIDLKSFYASVECVERGLDPFKDNLVVADPSRGGGAICLAISPALKSTGVKNRCRIFEIPPGTQYTIAMPRMKLYMKYSADIYAIYLRFVSSEDIHVYSVDECFIDLSPYLRAYKKSAAEMTLMMTDAVKRETGICATAGIGTNMFLAKVALDITAKHSPAHIGYLDEEEFRRTIWHHTPITDIWNIGRGIARRLEHMGAVDLYDVAHLDEQRLYKEFGVNAMYLIDHANGVEPCTMSDIRSYVSENRSLSNSQILFENYNYENALTVLKEMVDGLVLELVENGIAASSVGLFVGYADEEIPATGGSHKLESRTDSLKKLMAEFERIYRGTTLRSEPIRRLGITLGEVVDKSLAEPTLIDENGREADPERDERERRMQSAVLEIKQRYGKNAILKGISLTEHATAIARNGLVGGHNAE